MYQCDCLILSVHAQYFIFSIFSILFQQSNKQLSENDLKNGIS